jgi:hypothetical protein
VNRTKLKRIGSIRIRRATFATAVSVPGLCARTVRPFDWVQTVTTIAWQLTTDIVVFVIYCFISGCHWLYLAAAIAQLVQWLRAGRSGVRIPTEESIFLLRNVRIGRAAHSASYSMGTGVPPSGVKRSGREFGHSFPANAEVQDEWSYTSASPIHVNGMDRDDFTFSPDYSSLLTTAFRPSHATEG